MPSHTSNGVPPADNTRVVVAAPAGSRVRRPLLSLAGERGYPANHVVPQAYEVFHESAFPNVPPAWFVISAFFFPLWSASEPAT